MRRIDSAFTVAMLAHATVVCHCRAIRGNHPMRYFSLSGVSLGMAIGIRSLLAPLVVPFLLATVVFRAETARGKGLHALVFVAGGGAGRCTCRLFCPHTL